MQGEFYFSKIKLIKIGNSKNDIAGTIKHHFPQFRRTMTKDHLDKLASEAEKVISHVPVFIMFEA